MSKLWFIDVMNSGVHHGFAPGGIALRGLRDGLNVVYAPNASGKSTLASMMLQAMGQDGKAVVVAKVSQGGAVDEKTVSKTASAFATRPAHPRRYGLDVVELLKGLSEEKGELEKIVGSGVQLVEAPPKGYDAAGKEVASAKSELEKVSIEGQKAREIEASLPEKRARLERLNQMDGALRIVEKALDNLGHQARCAELSEALTALETEHPGIKHQSEEWLKSFESGYQDWESADRERVKAEKECRLRHLHGMMPLREEPEEALARTKRLAESISQKVGDLRHAETAWAQAETEEEGARKAFIRLEGDVDAWSCLDKELLHRLKSLLQASDSERERTAELEGFKRALEGFVKAHPELDPQVAERLQASLNNLTDWLGQASLPVPDRRPAWLLGFVVAGAVVAALPLDWVWRLGAGVVVALAAVAAYVALASKGLNEARRQELEREWASWEVKPSEASPAAVARAIADVTHKQAQGRAELEVRTALSTLANQEVKPSRFEELRKESGLVLDSPYQTYALFVAFEKAVQAYNRRVEQEKAKEQVEQEVQELRAELAQVMAVSGFQWEELKQPEAVQEQFAAWHRCYQEWLAARDRAEAAHQKVVHWLRIVKLDAVDLASDREVVLSRKSEAERHRGLRRDLDVAEREERNTRVPEELLLGAVELAGVCPLDSSLESVKAVLADGKPKHEALLKEITADEVWLKTFSTSTDAIRRAKEFSRAYEKLRTVAIGKAKHAVSAHLQAYIHERVAREATPKMILQANEVLRRTTNGRYELSVRSDQGKKDKNLGPLEVKDHEREKDYSFDELSTGTKVHAVMALKLGWIRDGEESSGSPKYPIIVDEPMAVSDVEASKALAEVLAAEARERQVIVFTNQPEDVVMLEKASKGACHELTIQGQTQVPAEVNATPEADWPELERPMGPSQFSLEVPVSSHSPAAVLPSDDRIPRECPTVSELLARHTWARDRFKGLVVAVEAVRKELRSQKLLLPPGQLARAGITQAKLPQAQELLEQCGGDAQEFLANFKSIDGIGQKKVDQLRDWMTEKGHLTHKAPRSQVKGWALEHLDPERDHEDLEWLLRVFSGHIVPD